MKKILIVIFTLMISFGLGACDLILNNNQHDVSFEDVGMTELNPLDAENTYPRENENNTTGFLSFGLNAKASTDVTSVDVLNVEYDGLFTLVIDISNPEKNSIHEIKIKNLNTGVVNTYQPGQEMDYDNDGEYESIFRINQDVNRIYLGVKLDNTLNPGIEVKYSVEDITYIDDGVVGYTYFSETASNVVSVIIEEPISVDNVLIYDADDYYIPMDSNDVYSNSWLTGLVNMPEVTAEDFSNLQYSAIIHNKFIAELNDTIDVKVTVQWNDVYDKYIYTNIPISYTPPTGITELNENVDYQNIYFTLSGNADFINVLNSCDLDAYFIHIDIAIHTSDGRTINSEDALTTMTVFTIRD